MKLLSAETNLSSATNVSSASVVRIFNSDSSAATVTKKDSGGSTIGTFTVGAGKVIYCEKNYTDTLEGGSGLKVSKVGYSHMMSYASYSSSGGGGSSIITTNLVLHLDASNSSSYSGSGTTWTDLSGSGNNGTLVNGVTYNSGEGGYLIFDGTNDTVTLPAGSDFAYGTGDFTIEMWYNVTGTTLQNYGEVLFAQTTNGVNYLVLSSSHGLTPVKKALFKGIASTTEYVEGAWNHLLVTRNGTTVTLYFNASAEGTGTVTQDFNNTTYVPTIGNYSQSNTNAHFDGKIAQLRIYKGKGFSASEVLQNYNATKSNYIIPEGLITTNLVLHLDASNSSSYPGSGTTWTDLSGNGNNLTLTNGPTYTSDDGGAIVFDGTNDSAVSALNQSFFQFGTDDYSYGLWVKLDTQAISGYAAVLSSGAGSEANSWQIDLYYANKYEHRLRNSAGTDQILITNTISNFTNTWHYLFVVNDRSEDELKIYVDGVLDTTASGTSYGSTNVGVFSSATDTKNVFNVARNRNQDAFIDGSVAQVHVYKGKALSAAEVLHNYNSTKSNYV